jgi:Cu(I)-responsive transcriptional regulator
MAKQDLTIGELAKATSVKPETIRYYERIGLLPRPPRTAGNYRAYGAEHVARLGFVRRSRELGFPLEAIRDLLRLADQRGRDCTAIDELAREHLAHVERKIADLTHLAHELRHVIGQCRGGKVAECRIIEALAPKRPTALAPQRSAQPRPSVSVG